MKDFGAAYFIKHLLDVEHVLPNPRVEQVGVSIVEILPGSINQRKSPKTF